jgi:hypothetical protein
MNEFLGWIDKELKDISKTKLYYYFFGYAPIQTVDGTNYISNKEKGIELVLANEKIISTIHFFGDGRPDEKKFRETMPLNINLNCSRQQILDNFGMPNESGGGQRNLYFGTIPYWDKYFFDTYSLHFQYSDEKTKIDLVTIMSLDLEKQFNISRQ